MLDNVLLLIPLIFVVMVEDDVFCFLFGVVIVVGGIDIPLLILPRCVDSVHCGSICIWFWCSRDSLPICMGIF